MKSKRFGKLILVIAIFASSPSSADDLSQATDKLIADMHEVERALRAVPAYREDPAGGYAHFMRMLRRSIEEQFLQDPDYPYFRVLDDWVREGGDNPDQRYLFARVDGARRYRIWGNIGSAHAVEFQLYEGQPWTGKGRSGDYQPFEDLVIDGQGNFEVTIASDATGDNALITTPATDTVLVRQIYREWNDESPGHVHIDALDRLGQPKPVMTVESVAERIRRVGDHFALASRSWPKFVEDHYLKDAGNINQVSDLIDTETVGGVKGRWMANGVYQVRPDQALVVIMPPTTARYQAIQLTDLWFASHEYADRVTSLNDAQSVVANDGLMYYVIAARDPGYSNWLSVEPDRRGIFLLRYDGVRGDIENSRWPRVRLVSLESLPELIPGFLQTSADKRASVLKERRQHIQMRYNR